MGFRQWHDPSFLEGQNVLNSLEFKIIPQNSKKKIVSSSGYLHYIIISLVEKRDKAQRVLKDQNDP